MAPTLSRSPGFRQEKAADLHQEGEFGLGASRQSLEYGMNGQCGPGGKGVGSGVRQSQV